MAGTSIRDRLLADRRALLDLGTRNRLINIPLRTKNIRAIEIVDCKSTEVFGHSLVKRSVVPSSILRKIEPLQRLADRRGRRHSHPKRSTGVHDRWQTETRSSKPGCPRKDYRSDYWTFGTTRKTPEEEQGVNILYLAFGLLKWFEDDKSDTERFAPLVLLPVRLERSSAADPLPSCISVRTSVPESRLYRRRWTASSV